MQARLRSVTARLATSEQPRYIVHRNRCMFHIRLRTRKARASSRYRRGSWLRRRQRVLSPARASSPRTSPSIVVVHEVIVFLFLFLFHLLVIRELRRHSRIFPSTSRVSLLHFSRWMYSITHTRTRTRTTTSSLSRGILIMSTMSTVHRCVLTSQRLSRVGLSERI